MAANPQDEYEAVAAEMVKSSPSTTGKMFGMPCVKNESGKAYAGYYEGNMVFKLTGPPHEEALTIPGAHLFDPMGGRPMKEWVQVPFEHASRWLELAQAALQYSSQAR
jgi:hypothetical protein